MSLFCDNCCPPRTYFSFVVLLVSATVCLVISIVSVILFCLALDSSIPVEWKDVGIVFFLISLPLVLLFYLLACCETNVQQRQGSVIAHWARLWAYIKSCCFCKAAPSAEQAPSANPPEDPAPSTSQPTNLGKSLKENVKMELSPSQEEPTTTDSIDSGRWSCLLCACCSRNPGDQEPSPSTTEDLAETTTEATDSASSIKEEIEMSRLNAERQTSPSIRIPADVPANSGRWQCFKRCFACKNADSREPTETMDELTSSGSGPSDFSIRSHNEGIEMASLQQQQAEAKAMAEDSSNVGAEDGKSTSTNVEREMENTQQTGESSKQVIDSATEESSDISIETAL